MIGMTVRIGKITGTVDAEKGQPDGTLLIRVKDKWFPASMVEPWQI
jgi:hypothetical protein